MTLSPRVAAAVGYFAGVVFFALDFSWFGETAGKLLGPLGFVLDVGPAAVEGLAFALAAAITALAAQRLRGGWLPLVAAAGFTLAELLRSSGLLGVPLYQIGAAFVGTPLAPLAAVGGVYLLTFVVALAGAALGAVAVETDLRSAAVRAGGFIAAVAAVACAATLIWPARHIPPPTVRVAAVQANITQSVKWEPASLPRAVARYTQLTATLRPFRPQFVVWPETVITTDLLLDPTLTALPANAALAADGARLRRQFSDLAQSLGAVVAVGSDEATVNASYNGLFFFGQHGLESVYRKRKLVPFAEFLPGPAWLRSLPFASLISNFGAGTPLPPIDARLRVAPLICWETGFTDLAYEDAAAGAAFFAIATDDAWFGDSDGPYAQAQLAQLRALETGRWIVRAAATGISGVIAPDGRWRAHSNLDTVAVVRGAIGEPQPTIYSRIGPWWVGSALALVVLAGFGIGRRSRA
jgi:apolipoprotein N-acyltransferase